LGGPKDGDREVLTAKADYYLVGLSSYVDGVYNLIRDQGMAVWDRERLLSS
jgi:hypothetical protein